MGLLQRAATLKETTTAEGMSSPLSPPPARRGLLARAESMRSVADAYPADRTAFHTIGRGLLSKASYFREHRNASELPRSMTGPVVSPAPKADEGSRTSISDTPRGLFEKALHFHEEGMKPGSETQWIQKPREEKREESLRSRRKVFEEAEALREETLSEAEAPGVWPAESMEGVHEDEDFLEDLLELETPEEEVVEEETFEGTSLEDTFPIEEEVPAREGGLLARAEKMQEELTVEGEGEAFSYEHEEETALPPEEAEYALDTSQEISSEWPEDEEEGPGDVIPYDEAQPPEEPPEEEAFEEESGRLAELTPGKEEEELSFPPLDYEGNSDEFSNPAADGAGIVPEEFLDPFDEWEHEAEGSAESVAISLAAGGPLREKEDRFLMDEQDEVFSTRHVEDRFDSGRKMDNYLSLFDLTKELAMVEEYNDFWESILYAILGQTGADRICIFSSVHASEQGAVLYPVAHSGFDFTGDWAIKPGDEIYERCESSAGFKYAEELEKGGLSSQEREILDKTEAYLIAPVRRMESLYAVITISRPLSGADYGIDDLEYINLLTDLISPEAKRILVGLEHARETEELRRRAEVQRKILSFSRNASSSRNLDDLYDMLVNFLEETLDAKDYSLILLSPQDHRYRIFGGNHLSTESMEKFDLRMDSDLVGMISNITRVYEFDGFRKSGDILSNYTTDDLELMRHYWIVPLINLNWLVGFITIHETQRPWTDFHREQIVSLSQVSAPLFASCIVTSERKTVFRDPFSPLQERLDSELKKAAAFNSRVSVVEIKVENIRRILAMNPGDDAVNFLSDLGSVINRMIFESDFMARTGQGRYAVVLPGRDRGEAEIFVKKVLAEFRRKNYLPASPIEIKYEYVVVTAPDDARDPARIISLLD